MGQYGQRMNEGSHGTNVQPAGRWSKILNESWPAAEVARRLSDVELDRQIPVTVRLVFDTGAEQLEGIAVRWTRQHVRVNVMDQRVRGGGIWVAAGDVSRR